MSAVHAIVGRHGSVRVSPGSRAEVRRETRSHASTNATRDDLLASMAVYRLRTNGTARSSDGRSEDRNASAATAEAVSPGVQRFHSASDGDANFHESPGNTLSPTHVVEKAPGSRGERRPFQPDGQSDLGKATAECRDALTKGQPVGR